MAKYEWNLDDGYVNRKPWLEFEINDGDLEGATENEIESFIYEAAEQEMWNRVNLLVRKKNA